jgi:hypothetical protein
MTGLVRRITLRQISPWGASAQNPQYPVEYGTAVLPWATATVFVARRLRYQWIQSSPLAIGEISVDLHITSRI